MSRLHKTSGWETMQDTIDNVHFEAAMNYSENLVNYWLVRKVISFVSYEDKFVSEYKSGVYREFKLMNFGDFLKAWPSRYRYKFNEC
jgi:hypothetical protein